MKKKGMNVTSLRVHGSSIELDENDQLKIPKRAKIIFECPACGHIRNCTEGMSAYDKSSILYYDNLKAVCIGSLMIEDSSISLTRMIKEAHALIESLQTKKSIQRIHAPIETKVIRKDLYDSV